MQRLLNKKQVAELTGLSRATIDRERRAHDFPEPIKLTKRRVAWTEASILEWLANRQKVSRAASLLA